MAASLGITLAQYKRGFLDKSAISNLVDARKRAIAQAIGEGAREWAKKLMPKARKLAMSVEERMARQLPRTLPLYAPNPAPGMPRIRIKKSDKTLRNLSRPFWMTDVQSSPNEIKIGPPKLQEPPAPMFLEQGGTKTSSSRRRVRRIGGGGEIDIDRGTAGRDGKVRMSRSSRSWTKAYPDDGSLVRVRYIRLRTAAQVARAQRINDSLYRPPRQVILRPRGYMKKIVATTLAASSTRAAANRIYYDSLTKLIMNQGSQRRTA